MRPRSCTKPDVRVIRKRNFPGRTVARVSVEDGTLMLQMNWNPPIKLQPVVQDEFNVGEEMKAYAASP